MRKYTHPVDAPQQIRWFSLIMGIILITVALSTTPGCSQASSQESEATLDQAVPAEYADQPQLRGEATVVMEVNTAQAGSGTITLKLDGNAAPLSAGNFADLVERGFYDGLTFHRVVKDPEPFVVQGGDPRGNGTGGFMDPETLRPRNIPLEIQVSGEDSPRYNELIDVVNSGVSLSLPHERGALAMARSQSPDSASSQFYIGLAALPNLDGRYAVFGSVVEGMELVDQIEVGDMIQSMTITEGAENLVKP